ncbi:MAG: hypothetical protein GF416_01200 [Candidatus Altiarchaeales archaeon]|nr:hypothetical protein [Candidatus Altiarchaeales archaeon]MBD3415733.1 hypothetical protein [Candidatus Altiarchaeales archaeon]
MLEFLKLIVKDYGLFGLLVSSFMGSTIFLPFSVELTFPFLVKAGMPRLAIMFFAALGSLGGTLLNYSIGNKGMNYVLKYTKLDDVNRAKNLMDRYGWAGLFIVLAFPVPFPVDPLTLFCGAAKMEPKRFTTVVFTAKLLKYALTLGVISIIL